jgi:hypothetical protein
MMSILDSLIIYILNPTAQRPLIEPVLIKKEQETETST